MKNKLNHFLSKGIEPISLRHDFIIYQKKVYAKFNFHFFAVPRAATIQASDDGTLWALDRQTFRRIVLRNAFQKRKMYEALIENVPLLSALSVSYLFCLSVCSRVV